WSRTKAPDDQVATEELQYLRRIAEELAGELLLLAETGLPMDAPPIPLFIPPVPTELPATGTTPPPGQLGRGLTGTTFLYQLKRLSTELAAAVHVREVLTAAQEQIMVPFGASALMLCRVQDERLCVVGASGFPREEVGRVDGLPLSRPTPETHAVT